MRKFILSSTLSVSLCASYAIADTLPVHIDGGAVAPGKTLSINVDPTNWPGFHDVICHIQDPSNSAIIRISSPNTLAERVLLNQTTYQKLPIQIQLNQQDNTLEIHDLYNATDETSNTLTFQNLDDDVTLTVQGCDVKPSGILSKEYTYAPSALTCAKNVCTAEGGHLEDWQLPAVMVDGYYILSIMDIYVSPYNFRFGYTNKFQSNAGFTITPKNTHLKPIMNSYTWWRNSGNNIDCNGMEVNWYDVLTAHCPLELDSH